VLEHHETPGLGDKIDEKKDDWIVEQFNGKSLSNPPPEKWQVKRDGGAFDQFTGATITPRSVVKAVKNTLLFVQREGDAIYAPPQQASPDAAPQAPAETAPVKAAPAQAHHRQTREEEAG